MFDRSTVAHHTQYLPRLPLVWVDGCQMMERMRRLLHPKIGRKESMPVQLVAEHRTAEFYERWSQWSARDILYDIRLSVVVQPGGKPRNEVWVLVYKPRAAVGHQAVSLTWRRSMDGVELPPVVCKELESVGLDEVLARIVRLHTHIDPYN